MCNYDCNKTFSDESKLILTQLFTLTFFLKYNIIIELTSHIFLLQVASHWALLITAASIFMKLSS